MTDTPNFIIEIKCPELAQAINNLAAAMSIRAVDGALVAGRETTEPEKPKAPARSAKAKETTTPTSEPETASDDGEKGTPEQEPATSSNGIGSGGDDAGIEYDVVKTTVMNLALKKGRGAVVELLTEFDVPEGKKADAIPAERWQAFVDRATEIMS